MNQLTKKNMMYKQYLKEAILLLIILIAFVGLFLIGPVKQDPNYHSFADQNSRLSIPNFWNVVSNLPFLIIGLSGIILIFQKILKSTDFQAFSLFFMFFVGILLTGIGSGYYHYNPTNESLFWDRLPMTISFVAFFSIVISEFISAKIGKRLFVPFLLFGIFSLIYWEITESKGVGDLRFYIIVQFLPIVLIAFILLFYKKKNKACFIQVLFIYLLAKFFELNDHFILSTTHLISGHSIKHLISSLAPLVFLIAIYRNKIGLNTNLIRSDIQEAESNKQESLTL